MAQRQCRQLRHQPGIGQQFAGAGKLAARFQQGSGVGCQLLPLVSGKCIG